MIIAEQSAESFTPSNGARGEVVVARKRRERPIPKTLVVALEVVVRDILGDELTQVPLPDRDDAAEALTANGADEALGEGIEIRAACRQAHTLDAGALKQPHEVLAEKRIAIVADVASVSQQAIDRIERPAQGIDDPGLMRVRGDARYRHRPRFDVDGKEHEVPHEPCARRDLDGEEIDSGDRPRVNFQECRPGAARLALRSRLKPSLLQNLGDGAAGQLAAEIEQGASDARIAPGRILSCHGDDELDQVGLSPSTSGSAPRATVVLTSDELAVPAQKRLGRDERRDAAQRGAADRVRAHRESPALSQREAQAPRALLLTEHSIFFHQVLEQQAIGSPQPACDHEDQELKQQRLRVRLHAGTWQYEVTIT